MNQCCLLGRLTADPTITTYGTGEQEGKMARYTLAVNRSFKTKDRQADFINCRSFGRTADNAEKYLKKGMLIAVTGSIQTGSYINKAGQKIFTTEVIVENAEFAESKKVYEDRIKAEAKANDAPTASESVTTSPVMAEPTQTAPTPTYDATPAAPEKKVADDDWMNIPDDMDEMPFS